MRDPEYPKNQLRMNQGTRMQNGTLGMLKYRTQKDHNMNVSMVAGDKKDTVPVIILNSISPDGLIQGQMVQ